MMYQQETPQYCYDQSGLQLPYNGADRGRAPPHLQPGKCDQLGAPIIEDYQCCQETSAVQSFETNNKCAYLKII